MSVPVLFYLLVSERSLAAFVVFVLAGLSDAVDGYLAKRFDWRSELGAYLDPLADKALLVTLFLVLGVLRLIPRWLVGVAIGRDLIILSGALLLRIFRGKQRFLPSMLGKVSTFFQIVLVLLVLLEAAFPYPLFRWLGYLALLLAAIFTCLSGLDYVRQGVRMARQRIDGGGGRE